MADVITGPGEYRQRNDRKATVVGRDADGLWLGWTGSKSLEAWWCNGVQYDPRTGTPDKPNEFCGNIACKWSDPLPDMTGKTRPLRPGEIVAPGDEAFNPEVGWGPSLVGEVVQKGQHFRRPLTSSPPSEEPQGSRLRSETIRKSLEQISVAFKELCNALDVPL